MSERDIFEQTSELGDPDEREACLAQACETASGLSMHVQRYLRDVHMQTCPPSVSYRFREFAWRKRDSAASGG